ncbi:hypothetical protein CRUP_026816, partial [Coryphaenoides rupestris]
MSCQCMVGRPLSLNFQFRQEAERDLLFLKGEFTSVFLSSVYPLLHASTLPCQRWADPASEQRRALLIAQTLDAFRTPGQSGSPVAEQDAF